MNGSEVSTRSLVLVPFAPEWLRALIESADRFEDASGLRAAPGLRDFFVSGEVSSGFVEALASASGPDPWGWGFAAILRDAGVVIGSGGFKGPPDEDGAVEIAYAIVPDQQGRGYATEVAGALAAFASTDARVRLLRAHTLPESNASTRVLARCGFVRVGEVVDPEDGPVWRWERAPTKPPHGESRIAG